MTNVTSRCRVYIEILAKVLGRTRYRIYQKQIEPYTIMSPATTKIKKYMSEFLILVDGKDFRVADGPGNRVCVDMNTGYDLRHYRKGLEDQLKDTGHSLQLKNETLHVRAKKIA